MFLLLALAVGLYALNVKADGVRSATLGTVQDRTNLNKLPTVTPRACEVVTGFDNGAVNLRTCGGTSCEVIRILTEGERLTILTAGLWSHVTTEDGVTGWLNSNYCKGK